MKFAPALLLLLVTSLLLLPACAQVIAETPNEEGVIEVVMTDYSFEPDAIRVKAGQTVTLLLQNEGSKMHEFMMGRDVHLEGNFTEGFAVDFFAGISPEVTGPGMVMGLAGAEMDMGGMEMGDESGTMPMPESTEDATTEMGDNSEAMPMSEPTEETSTRMDMGDSAEEMPMEEATAEPNHDEGSAADHEEGEHQEEMPAGEFGAFQRPLMDAHAGFMVMIDPTVVDAGEVTAVTFTVPEDKVGTWTFACFQERGQHYDDGMRGTFIVEGS